MWHNGWDMLKTEKDILFICLFIIYFVFVCVFSHTYYHLCMLAQPFFNIQYVNSTFPPQDQAYIYSTVELHHISAYGLFIRYTNT